MYHDRRYSGGSGPSDKGVCGGGGGRGKGWSSIIEGPGLPKKYVWSKNKGVGGGFPGPSPGSATEMHELYDELSVSKTWN